MENFITLSKLIVCCCCCSVPPPLYFGLENSNNTRNELARPVMGTIFLVLSAHMFVLIKNVGIFSNSIHSH